MQPITSKAQASPSQPYEQIAISPLQHRPVTMLAQTHFASSSSYARRYPSQGGKHGSQSWSRFSKTAPLSSVCAQRLNSCARLPPHKKGHASTSAWVVPQDSRYRTSSLVSRNGDDVADAPIDVQVEAIEAEAELLIMVDVTAGREKINVGAG